MPELVRTPFISDEDIIKWRLDIHLNYCLKNIKKCICGQIVNLVDLDEHNQRFHKDKDCIFCHTPIPEKEYDRHLNECSHKTFQCRFCDLELALSEVIRHEDLCGSKTEKCDVCSEFIAVKGSLTI